MSCSWEQVTADVQAAIDALPQPVYITGFCYGGAVSWMAAARCAGLKAASCFYGRMITDLLNEKPKIPVMLHYGAKDAAIPPENVEKVRAATPELATLSIRCRPRLLPPGRRRLQRRSARAFAEAHVRLVCALALRRS